MNNSSTSDINTTTTTNPNNFSNNHSNNNKKIFKQIWQLGNKHLVVIDKSIIEKLGITEEAEENSTTFVEQELTSDNTTILMRITKI